MRERGFTAYTIITTLLEEAALAGVVLWLLPRFRIDIPLWGLALLMAALGGYNYITYRLCKKTLDKKPVTLSSGMIGFKGKTTTPLDPEGVVRVHGELWKARANCTIDKDDEIVVVGMEGLTSLFVARSVNNRQQAGKVDIPHC